MPIDLFFYRHKISSLAIYLNALVKSVKRSVTLSVFHDNNSIENILT